ncbi:DDE-domain-containing protein [Histomonas meleagridis]|uniref:DDE-domain-containing protein n=1 Tax=Histomonas meleagridis TaxID=135588 RepID=UPI00355A5BF9|nr:DDE-domain-containing protein [Histomonas meleagridis]
MEADRVHCDESQIDEWFKQFHETFEFPIPASFVVNVDEVGFGGRELDRDVSCVVPMEYVGNEIPIEQDVNVDHHTMIAAIVADGSVIKPLIVIQRETVDLELLQLGYTTDKITYSKSDTGYINARIFKKWLDDCYLKDLQIRRQITGYDGPAILILDGCSCHGTDGIDDYLSENNVYLRYIPLHSSDQLQFFDIGLFANH